MFTARAYDIETGLYYYRARYYNPYIGRFLQIDPAYSSMNWYAYCGNNPINCVDPMGLYDYMNITYDFMNKLNPSPVMIDCYYYGQASPVATYKYSGYGAFASDLEAGLLPDITIDSINPMLYFKAGVCSEKSYNRIRKATNGDAVFADGFMLNTPLEDIIGYDPCWVSLVGGFLEGATYGATHLDEMAISFQFPFSAFMAGYWVGGGMGIDIVWSPVGRWMAVYGTGDLGFVTPGASTSLYGINFLYNVPDPCSYESRSVAGSILVGPVVGPQIGGNLTVGINRNLPWVDFDAPWSWGINSAIGTPGASITIRDYKKINYVEY